MAINRQRFASHAPQWHTLTACTPHIYPGLFENTHEGISQAAPLPMLGLDIWFALTPKWSVGTSIGAIGGSFDEIKATIFDASIMGRYALTDHFGLNIGAQHFCHLQGNLRLQVKNFFRALVVLVLCIGFIIVDWRATKKTRKRHGSRKT